MQSGNLFQTRVDSAADLGFILRVRGVIAVVGIADETILQTKCVDGFRQTRRERHDAADRLGNANRAAGFIPDFPEDWGYWRDRRRALRMRHRCARQQCCDCGKDGASEARACEYFHKSPVNMEFHSPTKKQHEAHW